MGNVWFVADDTKVGHRVDITEGVSHMEHDLVLLETGQISVGNWSSKFLNAK